MNIRLDAVGPTTTRILTGQDSLFQKAAGIKFPEMFTKMAVSKNSPTLLKRGQDGFLELHFSLASYK